MRLGYEGSFFMEDYGTREGDDVAVEPLRVMLGLADAGCALLRPGKAPLALVCERDYHRGVSSNDDEGDDEGDDSAEHSDDDDDDE